MLVNCITYKDIICLLLFPLCLSYTIITTSSQLLLLNVQLKSEHHKKEKKGKSHTCCYSCTLHVLFKIKTKY